MTPSAGGSAAIDRLVGRLLVIGGRLSRPVADRYILAAGLFPVEPELRFDHQIFIDKKPEFYDFAQETKNLTGAEVFAEHAKNSD